MWSDHRATLIGPIACLDEAMAIGQGAAMRMALRIEDTSSRLRTPDGCAGMRMNEQQRDRIALQKSHCTERLQNN